ncbi:hypothetical protein GM661_00310 [Iocasia frigidifontis]|uniref:Uncharacterized protein n=1 Tax=Iocasia fonsfrigidae TaxID=2682810 RepID=A0A8A7KCA3_9FIRM|nr:hypothetical protein [Iocasia fonsfrigidae]QTL96517.1 hypothetical protein GM661_00310 [Iocasia fonsfrigidae]
MNNNILLFAERSVITKKLRVVKFGIYIKENEHLEIIEQMRNILRENDEFALMLGILEA